MPYDDFYGEEVDFTKLKYVLYARKSTTDESRQLRSISDQIADCLLVVKRLHLNFNENTDIRTEEKSAKIPTNRPVFNQILKEIREGKYNAILAWNPDRLARNMKEAGVIIDMVDNDIIKDLKFVTHPFVRSANGLMLLGMAFVLSKQYSDDLSQKVSRGVKKSFEEGKSGQIKHGYRRTKKGFYKPDGNNFELIKEAWQMKLNNDSLDTIAQVINEKGYLKKLKSGKCIRLRKQGLSTMFADSFYYGLMKQAGKVIDLREKYNFKSVVSEADFLIIQSMGRGRRKIKSGQPFKETFYPLKRLVTCGYCGHICSVAPSTGRKQRYLYFDCKNKLCPKHKLGLKYKTTRAKIVFDFISDLLKDGLGLTDKDYLKYQEWFSNGLVVRNAKIKNKINSNDGEIKNRRRWIKEKGMAITGSEFNKTTRKVVQDQMEEWQGELDALIAENKKLQESIIDPEAGKLSLKNFTNISKNASTYVKEGDPIVKDLICRIIFSNLIVEVDKVADFRLNEPFSTLLKGRLINSGREYWIRTNNLAHPMRAR